MPNLDADTARRADFRKAVAYASHRSGFDPAATPTLQEDFAVAIALQVADTAYANEQMFRMKKSSILRCAMPPKGNVAILKRRSEKLRLTFTSASCEAS
jgi:hypothetical protein